MDATLQQVLTLGGSPLLRAAVILVSIVSIIVNYEKVIDTNGSGQRHLGLQSITLTIMAAYMVSVILQYLRLRIDGISIDPIDFS